MISILHKGEIGNGFELTAEGKLTIKAGDNVKVTDNGVNVELPDLSDIENRLTVFENNKLLDYVVPEGYQHITEYITKYNSVSKEILQQQILKEFVKNENRTDTYTFKLKDVVLKTKSKEFQEELTNTYSSWISGQLYMYKFDLTYTFELTLPTKFVDELKANVQNNKNSFLSSNILVNVVKSILNISNLSNDLSSGLDGSNRYQTLIGYETSNINVTSSEISDDNSVVTVEVSVQDLTGIFQQDLGETREFTGSMEISQYISDILSKSEEVITSRTPSEYPDVDKVDKLFINSKLEYISNTADDTVNFTYLIQE